MLELEYRCIKFPVGSHHRVWSVPKNKVLKKISFIEMKRAQSCCKYRSNRRKPEPKLLREDIICPAKCVTSYDFP